MRLKLQLADTKYFPERSDMANFMNLILTCMVNNFQQLQQL